MDEFIDNFKKSLQNGDYERMVKFEQKRLRKYKISHQFEAGETIDIIWDKVSEGKITYKNDIPFIAFMIEQIKNIISGKLYRNAKIFDGYKDYDELLEYSQSNNMFTVNELNYILSNIDLELLKNTIFKIILNDDEEAALILEDFIAGKTIKEIAAEWNLSESKTYSALRRARYKIEKELPDDLRGENRKAI